MRVCAIIAAAGLSTRMKQFKQLMRLENISFAERVVLSFRQAGVQDIFMITGYKAEELESQLKGFGVTFLKNENYETTQMFDSVKIGLNYAQEHYDRVFFCPVDVPLFRANTIELELSRTENLVFPVCHNRLGHPILFDASIIPQILSYTGEHGLKGALDSLSGQTACYLPVDDEGAIMDADNPEDMRYLISFHNRNLLRAEVAVSIAGTKLFFDAETRLLLKQIEAFGNVQEACRRINISYSKGWKILRSLERELGYVIVERQAGGKNGGSAAVTPRGLRLIELYELLEKRIKQSAAIEFNRIFSASDLFPNSSREKTGAKP